MQLSVEAWGLEDMRFSKVILTALFALFAVLAGLFIAAVAAIVSLVVFLFGRSQAKDAVTGNNPLSRAPVAPRFRPTARDFDVIDVTATKVPVEATSR